MYAPLAGLQLPALVWSFYALGPQLLICLALGYWTARRRGSDLSGWRHSRASDWRLLIDWITTAFIASLVPVAGVLVMLWLWHKSPRAHQRQRPSATERPGVSPP
jgi:hypothetical protein